jgi:glycerol-3-phosphate O-acyltransferase
MVEELEGGAKKDESVLGLVRARKVLQRRFGSVFVNFGEPISLADSLGSRRAAFEGEPGEAQLDERRRFTEGLGNAVVERINWAMAANATSVAACALLGEPKRGAFRTELVERMRQVVDLLRLQDVQMTPALLADEGEFRESIAFLVRAGLIESREDPRGEILSYDESRRRALDVYRNILFHFIATPSLIARRLLRGATADEVRTDLAFWLDLLYHELFVPRGLVMAVHLDAFLDYFERIGTLERRDGALRVTEKGEGYFCFLAEQTRSLLEAYYATCAMLQDLESAQPVKQLEKSAEEQFERLHLLGEVQRREGWNVVTLRNALDLFVRRSILVEGPAAGRDRTLGPGSAFADLATLRERLAGALASR